MKIILLVLSKHHIFYFYSLWTLNNARHTYISQLGVFILRAHDISPLKQTLAGIIVRHSRSGSGSRLTFILSPLLDFGSCAETRNNIYWVCRFLLFLYRLLSLVSIFLRTQKVGGIGKLVPSGSIPSRFLLLSLPGGSGVTVDIVCTCLLSSESHKGLPLIPVAQNPLSTVMPLMI